MRIWSQIHKDFIWEEKLAVQLVKLARFSSRLISKVSI